MLKPTVAYFSMEIGLENEMKTYAGGLGILAGDTLKTACDLEVPMVGVSLLYRFGYFKQSLNKETGEQLEEMDSWDFNKLLQNTGKKFSIQIQNRTVVFQIWKYEIKNETGFSVPVFFLDADLEENVFDDRCISWNLYTKYQDTRLRQEISLGIGGVKALEVLGYGTFDKYHLNESHAAFALLALQDKITSKEVLKKHVVFTTHTPVLEGHRGYEKEWYKDYLEDKYFQKLEFETDKNWLSLTKICLNLSGFSNGVSKKHSEVSNEMFPGYKIGAITNGVHLKTWVSGGMKNLYQKYLPHWQKNNAILKNVEEISVASFAEVKKENKQILIDYINKNYSKTFSEEVFTIGFARRTDGYKRADLIFKNLVKLQEMAVKFGGLQLVFAGKSYPDIVQNEGTIKRIYELSKADNGPLKVIFLENYNMDIAKKMVAGNDLWLNNPKRPLEASGTSGMKAAANGVPNFSILDGWWIESCLDGVNGWSIGDNCRNDDEQCELDDLYSKLENKILPIFTNDKEAWMEVCKQAISSAGDFNTQRMLKEYVEKAYQND